MTFSFKISSELQKTLNGLARKDKALAITVRKKVEQIVSCDESSIKHYKNLKGTMSHLKRVHIRQFVLLFQVSGNIIIFEKFCHHDEAYQ